MLWSPVRTWGLTCQLLWVLLVDSCQLSTLQELTQLERAASLKATSPSCGSPYVVTGLKGSTLMGRPASELPAGLAEALLRLHCNPAVPLPSSTFSPLASSGDVLASPYQSSSYMLMSMSGFASWEPGTEIMGCWCTFWFWGARSRAIEIDVQVTVICQVSGVLQLAWEPLLWDLEKEETENVSLYPSFSSKEASQGPALNRSKGAGSLSVGGQDVVGCP